ncbi:19840_t:CDS:2 [Dentiscutata erythropus]|uniref:19840_t:CDS:1 n=1 Tax=Dentiscutata erythropus TaxID=1348616 RepID=A0A9N9H2G4_9GLOM|nr:19840_t:CDS:2 [Dentiscutata erythropus]
MDTLDTLKKYRDLWWNQGNLHPIAEWEKVKLPYVLVENVIVDKYEEHRDRFNVHACWEWLPLQAHEVCINEISHLMMEQCLPVKRTDATVYRTRVKGFGKEHNSSFRPKKPNSSFRPKKSAVDSSNGSDGLDAPWPNIIIEVASSEPIKHVKDKVRNYWLNGNRIHDVIIVKLYYDGENPAPSRMKVWHYCISGPYMQQKLKPKNKFEFGTYNAKGDPLNYQEGTCLIKIPLDCLYHDVKPQFKFLKTFFRIQLYWISFMLGKKSLDHSSKDLVKCLHKCCDSRQDASIPILNLILGVSILMSYTSVIVF